MKIRVSLLALALGLSGCASVNNALTPGTQITNDQFTGAKQISQSPVSAASGLGQSWNVLGFAWFANNPNVVVLMAGVNGIQNVEGVAFNVDGKIISAQPTTGLTDYGAWSNAAFAVSYEQFLAIANGHDVRMRIDMGNSYSDSSFGSSHPGAIVNTKFAPFIASVQAAKG